MRYGEALSSHCTQSYVNGIIAFMNKGYAFGFLIVLLVLILGLYVSFTGFVSSREALRAQPTSPPNTRSVQATSLPASPTSTATATIMTLPTPVPGATETPTPEPATGATEPPPVDTPVPAPTQPPEAPPTNTPLPEVQPPTPEPVSAYQFRLAGPPTADSNYPNCCYIFGTIRDAGGNGLEGVQVQAFNEWNELPAAVTKGGGEIGQYNIPIGRDVVTWYVVVLDAAGNRISTQSPVLFDPNVANGYRLDWQRTY